MECRWLIGEWAPLLLVSGGVDDEGSTGAGLLSLSQSGTEMEWWWYEVMMKKMEETGLLSSSRSGTGTEVMNSGDDEGRMRVDGGDCQ